MTRLLQVGMDEEPSDLERMCMLARQEVDSNQATGGSGSSSDSDSSCSERSCSEDETPGFGGSLASSSGSCPTTQVTTPLLAGQLSKHPCGQPRHMLNPPEC